RFSAVARRQHVAIGAPDINPRQLAWSQVDKAFRQAGRAGRPLGPTCLLQIDGMHPRRNGRLAAQEIEHGKQVAVMADVVDAVPQFAAASNDLSAEHELSANLPKPPFELQEDGVDAGFGCRIERAAGLEVRTGQRGAKCHRPVDSGQIEVQRMFRRETGGNFEVAVRHDAHLGAVHQPRVGIAECADAPAAQSRGSEQGSFKERPLLRGKTGHAQPQDRLLCRDAAHVRDRCHRKSSPIVPRGAPPSESAPWGSSCSNPRRLSSLVCGMAAGGPQEGAIRAGAVKSPWAQAVRGWLLAGDSGSSPDGRTLCWGCLESARGRLGMGAARLGLLVIAPTKYRAARSRASARAPSPVRCCNDSKSPAAQANSRISSKCESVISRAGSRGGRLKYSRPDRYRAGSMSRLVRRANCHISWARLLRTKCSGTALEAERRSHVAFSKSIGPAVGSTPVSPCMLTTAIRAPSALT